IVAGDARAHVTVAVVAAGDDVLRADRGDDVVDLDVEVVHRQVQARHRTRRPGQAEGGGIGLFRRQVRVAAAVGEHARLRIAGLRIGNVVVAGGAGGEQLGQVGRADIARAVEARTQAVGDLVGEA